MGAFIKPRVSPFILEGGWRTVAGERGLKKERNVEISLRNFVYKQ